MQGIFVSEDVNYKDGKQRPMETHVSDTGKLKEFDIKNKIWSTGRIHYPRNVNMQHYKVTIWLETAVFSVI